MTHANTIPSNDFQAHQRAFTHWIRHPEHAPLPNDVPAERMTIYHELIFNNISSFIEHTFPVTQALLPAEVWRVLILQFFQQGQCDSPYYYDISMHFKDFIDQKSFDTIESLHSLHQQYPWLRELMQYEWMELYVDMAEVTWRDDQPPELTDFDFRASSHSFSLKTKCWILAYQYPVETWSTTTAVADIQIAPTCLLIFRNQSDEIQIHSLHPLWAFLIENIQQLGTAQIDMLASQLQAATQLTQQMIDETITNLLSWLKTLTLLHVNIADQK